MEFTFSEDQELLQQTIRDFLASECTVDFVRAQWESETGRSRDFWRQLAEIGVVGLRVPEALGGLGMDEIDFVLLLEETGRAALAEPVISTAVVAVPLLIEQGGAELRELWLPAIAAGDAVVAVGHAQSPFVSDAHVADLLLLPNGEELHAVAPDAAQLTAERSNDPSRRLFCVEWTPAEKTRIASGETGRRLQDAAFDRGALACSAEQLGVCDQLASLSVEYATQRLQFGVPIGSFQAVKHMLANVVVKLEYARSLVYRAAHSVARDGRCRAVDVSMAKVATSDAALQAARTALQVHGAIGYTWEQDLHVWMRRAWSLDLAWGDGAWHRARLASGVIDGALPAESFGYRAPRAA